MNDAVRIATEGLLTTDELAARADFALGLTIVSPSTRTMAGPGGTADIAPRVMQVLVVLADAAGQVVTRRSLFERCWGVDYVGDDSLNRSIREVRKLAAEVGGGSFEIETIPRTGYRLFGARGMPFPEPFGQEGSTYAGFSRRQLFIGGGSAVAALAIGGKFWWSSNHVDPRFQNLIGSAEDSLRRENLDEKTVKMLQEAVSMRPDSAKAWGLLALVRSLLTHNNSAGPMNGSPGIFDAEKAARKALSLDATEPNALLALFELQGSTLDWISRDHKLRQIIAIAPDSLVALMELGSLTAATGLIRESWDWNERGLALEPLSSDFLGKRALKLWVWRRTSEADKVSDQLRALYPSDPWAWFVRVQIYAFTGRAHAALGMLDGAAALAPVAALWRESLPALDDPSPANVAKARDACIRAVQSSGMTANEAILIMSGLRELDTAFDIAYGTLLSRGPLVPRDQPGSDRATNNASWRVNTQWMWVPPVTAMRADPRFLPLCDAIGLADYWRRSNLKPDYMRSRA